KTSEEPWEKDGEPIDTGSNRMLVTPIVIGGHAEGTLLPEHPSGYEVARLDLLVMNILSKILWIQNVHGHPILSIAGKIDGVNLNIGSIINRPTDGMGNTSPSPEFVERDPDALRASLELLYWAVSQVNAAQKQFGVTAQSNTDAAQTAESKSYDYQATNQALRSTIKHVCRPIDNTVLSNYMYLKSSSDDEWENQRTYPDDFFPDTAETIDELIALEELAVNRGLIDVAEETWLVIIEMLAPNLSIARKQELKDSLGVLEKFTTDDGQEVVVRKLPDDDLEEDE
ncbi:MAG: hypothetical protein GY799_29355, partial [Desulfobulbaceae bacterium]|nr:hypothetical protein [Desulfobulbaceae bacterium]